MAIYRIANDKIQKVNAISPSSEKEVQTLVEQNLQQLLGIRFLETEYRTVDGSGRIDTLAVDEGGAPVIIEYKRKKDDNIITQALSYLYWLKTQDYAFFEKLVHTKIGHEISTKVKDNWKYPRVICIANQYNKNDTNAVKVIPNIRLELYLYRYYEGGIFSLEEEVIAVKSQQSGEKNQKGITVGGNTATLDEHANYAHEANRQLFLDLHDRILSLDDNITYRPTSEYIAYRLTKNFAEIHVQKQKIQIYLRPKDYFDPKCLVTKVSEKYGWVLDRRIYINSQDQLDDVMSLIEQSYQDVL